MYCFWYVTFLFFDPLALKTLGNCRLFTHVVFGTLAGAAVIIILVALIIIVYVCKRKRYAWKCSVHCLDVKCVQLNLIISKVKGRKRLHHSSQRSNSFDISYRRNRSEGGSNNRHSTGTECHSNPDFGQQEGERPRSDVPDILENRVLNKVTAQTKREATASAHIYADPVYSEMYDEQGRSGVMVDNAIYTQNK